METQCPLSSCAEAGEEEGLKYTSFLGYHDDGGVAHLLNGIGVCRHGNVGTSGHGGSPSGWSETSAVRPWEQITSCVSKHSVVMLGVCVCVCVCVCARARADSQKLGVHTNLSKV